MLIRMKRHIPTPTHHPKQSGAMIVNFLVCNIRMGEWLFKIARICLHGHVQRINVCSKELRMS